MTCPLRLMARRLISMGMVGAIVGKLDFAGWSGSPAMLRAFSSPSPGPAMANQTVITVGIKLQSPCNPNLPTGLLFVPEGEVGQPWPRRRRFLTCLGQCYKRQSQPSLIAARFEWGRHVASPGCHDSAGPTRAGCFV